MVQKQSLVMIILSKATYLPSHKSFKLDEQNLDAYLQSNK